MKKPSQVITNGAYPLDNFMKFIRDTGVGYEVVKSKDNYVVTIHDKGNKKTTFNQHQFQNKDLQLLRNDIRNYLSKHKISVR